jgi:twitching motility protein PilT
MGPNGLVPSSTNRLTTQRINMNDQEDTRSFLEVLTELLTDEAISDVHLQIDHPIWVRSGGEMQIVRNSYVSAVDLNNWLQSRYKDASPVTRVLELGGQDDFALNLGNFRIRAHAWMSQGQLNVAVRRLSNDIPPLASLGLPASVQRLIEAPQGLVLVTGPTGSGKSTTLASMIDWLNANTQSHIITLEDPIEYVHKDRTSRMRQRQVGEAGDCSDFAAGVIGAMREDPDVILIGEMRDVETVEAALNAAQTGHLVLATLHTNSATETINRILAFFTESDRELARSVLASVLRGVVSQRLVRTKDGKRVLALEILMATQAIRVHITGGRNNLLTQEMSSGAIDGQLPLNQSLIKLLNEKIVDQETALMASNDRPALERLLGVAA